MGYNSIKKTCSQFHKLSKFKINMVGLVLMDSPNSQWCTPPMYVSASHWLGSFWRAQRFFKNGVEMKQHPLVAHARICHNPPFSLPLPLSTAACCDLYCRSVLGLPCATASRHCHFSHSHSIPGLPHACCCPSFCNCQHRFIPQPSHCCMILPQLLSSRC